MPGTVTAHARALILSLNRSNGWGAEQITGALSGTWNETTFEEVARVLREEGRT